MLEGLLVSSLALGPIYELRFDNVEKIRNKKGHYEIFVVSLRAEGEVEEERQPGFWGWLTQRSGYKRIPLLNAIKNSLPRDAKVLFISYEGGHVLSSVSVLYTLPDNTKNP